LRLHGMLASDRVVSAVGVFESFSALEDRKTMNVPRLRGLALIVAVVIALLVGLAFYAFLIGIFERTAAVVCLAIFVTMAAIIWTRSDGESKGTGA
jgi:uncharacterized membrane protein YphA (DoxX/SURF4 family)